MRWSTQKNKPFLQPVELALFAILGAIMFCSKLLMEFLPNIHLLGTLTMVYTILFRAKALVPIYVYVALCVLYAGFSPWCLFHLYVWAVLWGVTMLLPRRMPRWLAMAVYPTVCALHGLAYGTLCAPAQALVYGFDLPQMMAWIVAGLPFDLLHGVGNLLTGLLIIPLTRLLERLRQRMI